MPLLAIETKRHAEFFRRLLMAYGVGSEIVIDGRPRLLSEVLDAWCKNRAICQTKDFLLKRGGVGLCGFHDHPSQTWMAASELAFARQLEAERLIRVRLPKITG